MASTAELPLAPSTQTVERLARRARLLSWPSLAWMTVEGAVAIAAGIVAGSVALVGFGLDLAIEGFASVVIIWRFTGHRIHSAAAEDRAQKLVAIQFFILAPYVAIESVRALVDGSRPDETLVGIVLACGSVVVMPVLAIAKQRIAEQVGSAVKEGREAWRGEGCCVARPLPADDCCAH
jgi:divalent metal cation (Fe/Co/Zn/Cd) transporter